jgi:hypothetical protein
MNAKAYISWVPLRLTIAIAERCVIHAGLWGRYHKLLPHARRILSKEPLAQKASISKQFHSTECCNLPVLVIDSAR